MRVKKEINIQIGEQIKVAREQAKLTQEQLSERVDVSPQYISDLERGVVGIYIPTLKRVCTTLGVSSDLILFGTATQNRVTAINDLCKSLTEEQFVILTEVIGKFVKAIETVQYPHT